jgi:hypothetical protein
MHPSRPLIFEFDLAEHLRSVELARREEQPRLAEEVADLCYARRRG